MPSLPIPRTSPWVVRIIVVAAAVQLLLATIFTAPAFVDALAFVPGTGLARPWTFVTYIFVHGGLLHLLINSVVLISFGPSVERRMGSGKFIAYFLYCGIGAAAFAAGLDTVHPVGPFIGMSGAIMGVALAYALLLPDRDVFLFPLPFPIRAKVLIALLAAFDLAGAFLWHDGIAHEAHLGGLLFGWLYFRLNALRGGAPIRRPAIEGVVLVGHGSVEEGHRSGAVPRGEGAPRRPQPRAGSTPDREGAELDRLLDKIGATGIGSLTPEERRYLDEVSKRRQYPH